MVRSDGWIERLKRVLGSSKVEVREYARRVYSYDSSGRVGVPACVVFPESEEEVVDVVRVCYEEEVPMVPRGAGTSLSGGPVPAEGSVVVCFAKMRKVLDYRPEDYVVVVQPGIVNYDLQKFLAKDSLFFPPDPASYKFSTIGGNVAENSGGPRAFRYGTVKDYVLRLNCVVGGGKVLELGALTHKSVSGLNLLGLFVGSEGLFGMFTEIGLKLKPLCTHFGTALGVYRGRREAAERAVEVLKRKVPVLALEYMDGVSLGAVLDANPRLPVPRGGSLLIAEVEGNTEEEVRFLSSLIERVMAPNSLYFSFSTDPREREELWEARRSNFSAVSRLGERILVEDVTVLPSVTPRVVEFIEQLEEKYEISVPTIAHIGDGNMHPQFVFSEEQRESVEKAVAELFEWAVSVGGTLTGEHGIGLEKKEFLRLEKSVEEVEYYRALKRLFDPRNLFNPGKVF